MPHVLRNIFSPKRGKITADRTKRIYIKKLIFCAGHGMLLKVNISRYRPEQVLGGSGRLKGFRIFAAFGTMKMVRSSPLRTGRLYPQQFSWYSFLEAQSTPGHMVPSAASEKFPATPPGIDPETLRLVAQRLNHYATPGPSSSDQSEQIKKYEIGGACSTCRRE